MTLFLVSQLENKEQTSSVSENIGLVYMAPLTLPEFMAAQHLKKAGHNSYLYVLSKTRDLQAFLPCRKLYIQNIICGEPHGFPQHPYVHCSLNMRNCKENKIRYLLNPFSNNHLETRNLFYFLLQRNPPLCPPPFIAHFIGNIPFPPKVNV